MGYLINHSRLSKVIPTKDAGCLASKLSSVLSSDSWKGRRCFVICGGPSLADFDPNLLQNELTIGINKSFVRFSTTINYAMDQRLYDSVTYPNRKDSSCVSFHQKWSAYRGLKVFLKYSGKWTFDPSVYVVDNIKKRALSLDVGTGIFSGNNSGFGGMMLAIALGCTQIYLLGCDLKVDSVSKKTHWHDGYAHQKFESVQNILPKFIKEFSSFSSIINKQGISVVNLNPDSALTCFPTEVIQNVL